MNITNCRYCNSSNLNFVKTPDTIHYGKFVCGHCDRFSHWTKNPDSPRTNSNRINKQTIKEISKFHEFEKDFCWFCLRTKEQLGSKETLTIDHIQELDKGGKDSITNMQILCSACHKLKNWSRLYMNWHLNEVESGTN